MKKSNLILLKDNFLASILGILVYFVIILIIPPIEENLILDLVIFAVSYLIGSISYELIKNRKSKSK